MTLRAETKKQSRGRLRVMLLHVRSASPQQECHFIGFEKSAFQARHDGEVPQLRKRTTGDAQSCRDAEAFPRLRPVSQLPHHVSLAAKRNTLSHEQNLSGVQQGPAHTFGGKEI